MGRNEKGIKLLEAIAADHQINGGLFAKLDAVREGIEAAIEAGVSLRVIAAALSKSEFPVSHATLGRYINARSISRSRKNTKLPSITKSFSSKQTKKSRFRQGTDDDL